MQAHHSPTGRQGSRRWPGCGSSRRRRRPCRCDSGGGIVMNAGAMAQRGWQWVSTRSIRIGSNIATAFVQIWANKGRSILTTLGIIIAVTAIITVVAFVEGFGNYMSNMLRGYGTRQMIVRSFNPQNDELFGNRRVTLTMNDVKAVTAECPHVRRITPFVFQETTVTYGKAVATQIPIRGVS